MLDKFDIEHMQEKVERFKQGFDDMIFVSFPGDEEMMGGCLASGRGFFHINANGGAEPCPFSPYSKLNLKTDSIETVLRSGSVSYTHLSQASSRYRLVASFSAGNP